MGSIVPKRFIELDAEGGATTTGAEAAGAAPPDPFADALAEEAPVPPATGMLPLSGDTIDANLLCAPLAECAVTTMAGLAGAPGEPRCAILADMGERCGELWRDRNVCVSK